MRDDILSTSLHNSVDYIEIPNSIWDNIQNQINSHGRRKVVFRKIAAAVAAVVLFFTVSLGSITTAGAEVQNSWLLRTQLGSFSLTIIQNIGKEVAGITPTLFLPTTLSQAKQVAKIDIKVPTYLPAGATIDDNTPTLVGRFGSFETVAIKVIDDKVKVVNGDSEQILLDIRQTTAKDLVANFPANIKVTTEKVKINGNDGLLTYGNGLAPGLYWADKQYSYRMFGPTEKNELLKIAESMK